MKKNSRVRPFWTLLLIVLLSTKPLAAQSSSSQALNWFKIGVNENDPQKKIAAYLKALEYDPRFIEAMYNLGMAYKKQQDYLRAEQFLLQAYHTNPVALKNEMKLQILYELATTYKRLGRPNDAEESLHGAKALAVDPKMHAKLSLEIGRFLYEQGRLQEALAELPDGANVDPRDRAEAAKLRQLVESEMELQKLYDAAEKARASGDWEQAMALLDQVRAKNPAYKDVAAKINELDSLLEAKTKKDVLAAMYEQAQKYEAEGNLEMAITSYENLLQQDASFRDASAKLQQAREQLEQKQLSEKLESEYAAGLQALKTQDWTSAVLAFEKVLELDRDHRDAHRRLAAAKKGLERESTETILARYYAEGVTAMNNNDLGGALAALEKVRQLNPAYRDVADLLSALEVKLAGPAPSPATNAAALPASVDSLYQEALSSMDKEDWVQAVVALEKIQLLQPNYRDVGDRLTVARVNLNNAAIIPKSVEPPVIGNTPLYVGSALTALIVLPLLGFIVFSPATRARIHCWRGNYMAAAQTYERILTRHPGRLRLYPTLANIYLLLGRKDEGALKVFKTILQLNLATRNREEINAIVAQNYLTEGRMDADAIEVLESALEAERRKQSPV